MKLGIPVSKIFVPLPLLALLVYSSACLYQAAWAPDSKTVIFTQSDKQAISALVLTDLDCKIIRKIKLPDSYGKKSGLTPAAWSFDGKRIAYSRQSGGKDGFMECVVQSAKAPYEEKVVLRTKGGGLDAETLSGMAPQWTEDGLVAFQFPSEDGKGMSIGLFDRDGNPKWTGKVQLYPVLSPDGRWLAECEVDNAGLDERTGNIFIRNLSEKDAAPRALSSELGSLCLPPVFSPDSEKIYMFAGEKTEVKDQLKISVRAMDLESGKISTVCELGIRGEKEGVEPCGLYCTPGKDILCVEYIRKGDGGIAPCSFDVYEIDRGNARLVKSIPLPLHYGTALSPDGHWLAISVLFDEDKLDSLMGMIISLDSDTIRCLPTIEMNEDGGEPALREALTGIAAIRGIYEPTETQIKGGIPELERMLKEIDSKVAALKPEFRGDICEPVRESFALMKVVIAMDFLYKGASCEDRDKAICKAFETLESYRRMYPQSRLLAGLDKEFKKFADTGK